MSDVEEKTYNKLCELVEILRRIADALSDIARGVGKPDYSE